MVPRALSATLAALALCLGVAAPALADSKISVSGGVMYFRNEDAGISNTLTVDNDSRRRVHFFDEADPYGMNFPAPPCSPGRINSAGNPVEVFCVSAARGLMKSIAGAALGADWPRNTESGCALYPACTFFTFSRSPGLKSCVRYMPNTNSVSERITLLTPFGGSPFQFGPAIR